MNVRGRGAGFESLSSFFTIVEDREAGGVGARAFPLPLPLVGAEVVAFVVGFTLLAGEIEILLPILAFLAGRCDFLAEGAFLVVVEEGIVRKVSLSAGLGSSRIVSEGLVKTKMRSQSVARLNGTKR